MKNYEMLVVKVGDFWVRGLGYKNYTDNPLTQNIKEAQTYELQTKTNSIIPIYKNWTHALKDAELYGGIPQLMHLVVEDYYGQSMPKNTEKKLLVQVGKLFLKDTSEFSHDDNPFTSDFRKATEYKFYSKTFMSRYFPFSKHSSELNARMYGGKSVVVIINTEEFKEDEYVL